MKRAIKDLQDFNGKGATEQAPLPPRRQRVKTNRLSDEKPAPPPPRKRKAPTKEPAPTKAQSSSPVLLKKRRQPEERGGDATSAGHQGPQGPGQDRGVVTDGCREKGDLVDVLLDARVYLRGGAGSGAPRTGRRRAEPASDDDDDELQWNDQDSSDDDEPWAADGDGSETGGSGVGGAAGSAGNEHPEAPEDASEQPEDVDPRRWRRRARAAGVRELWEATGSTWGAARRDHAPPRRLRLAAMEAQAAELRTKALGLAFLAAEARGRSGLYNDEQRTHAPDVEVLARRAAAGTLSLAEAVVAGSGAFAHASAFRKLADEVWRHGARSIEAAENCLAGHKVCFTGVFETIGRNRPDTQGHIRELTARFGGICDGVRELDGGPRRGPRREGRGRPPRRQGESPTTSSKYRNALKENEKRGKKEAAEQRSFDEQAAKIAAKKARKPYEKRKYPAPSLDEIRYTPRTGAMHGRGEVGAGALADALAAPKGFTLDNALAPGEQLDGIFAHTMLQRCACADGAGGKHDDDDGAAMEYCESYVTVQWSGAAASDERGGGGAAARSRASAHRGQSTGDCLTRVGVRRNDAPTDKGHMYF
ncbi:hypothetical protein JL720_15435 [Aureococcus anophagefferens]|nr:hypothetical protein JL720_15435 [Aureococcus anophagefferens]